MLSSEYVWQSADPTSSGSASLEDIDEARKRISVDNLFHLPLFEPSLGHKDEWQWKHTLRVAQVAVKNLMMQGDEKNLLDFNPPDRQNSPRTAHPSTHLASRDVSTRLDAWQAALVRAADKSGASHIVCSTYMLQAAARHELRCVLGLKRLAYQWPAFQRAPRVTLEVNSAACPVAHDLMWRMLRNVEVLDVHFHVDHDEQRRVLRALPAGSLRCIALSGIDVHDTRMLAEVCRVLGRVKELEAFQLGAPSATLSTESAPQEPLPEAPLHRLSQRLRRAYRIISVDFSNPAIQSQVCWLARMQRACSLLAACCRCVSVVLAGPGCSPERKDGRRARLPCSLRACGSCRAVGEQVAVAVQFMGMLPWTVSRMTATQVAEKVAESCFVASDRRGDGTEAAEEQQPGAAGPSKSASAGASTSKKHSAAVGTSKERPRTGKQRTGKQPQRLGPDCGEGAQKQWLPIFPQEVKVE